MIGGGTSGGDLVTFVSKTVNHLAWSQHSFKNRSRENDKLPNVSYKGDIKRFTETGVEFVDGTYEPISVVLCATGTIIIRPIFLYSVQITLFIIFRLQLFVLIFGR